MGVHQGEVFKVGDRTVVALPDDVAAALGTNFTITHNGFTVTLKPIREVSPEAALANNRALAAELRAIWADAPYREVEVRDPDIFPDRPGLL